MVIKIWDSTLKQEIIVWQKDWTDACLYHSGGNEFCT